MFFVDQMFFSEVVQGLTGKSKAFIIINIKFIHKY